MTVRPQCLIIAGAILVSGLLSTSARGQYVLLKAREEAGLYNYAKAIPLYETAYKKKKTAEAARGAALSYYKQLDFPAAESWYGQLVSLPDHIPADEFNYAEALVRNGKYEQAGSILAKLDTAKLAVHPSLVQALKATCDSAGYWTDHPRRGKLANLHQLNSAYADWGAGVKGDQTVFSSNRPTALKNKQPYFRNSNIRSASYGWTGEGYQHIYASRGIDSASIVMLDTALMRGFFHTAAASFTADGKELFFAGTRYVKKKAKVLGKDPAYEINIEIYHAVWDPGRNAWGEPRPFPYNDVLENSLGDPFVSPDGQTLYFVSNVTGTGQGGTDIFYSKRLNDTGWSPPVNIGSDINTPGNERTPHVDSQGNLYFASDGRAGLGGLDIYKAAPLANGGWQVSNAGLPVNSPGDDFSPYFKKGYHGYFASNRPGGKGADDLYQFSAVLVLEGEVLHLKTGAPVSSAIVTLVDEGNATQAEVTTNAGGKFSFVLDTSERYRLNAVKTGLTGGTFVHFSTLETGDSTVIYRTLYLDEIPPPPAPEAPIAIENIYYNFDRSNIRRDALDPLDHIVRLMKDHPDWQLHISSHTDSRGGDRYNMLLSDRRARAAMQYLITHGIDANRLSARGYGETRLVNGCKNGVPCSAQAHQLNRRSEFKIINK